KGQELLHTLEKRRDWKRDQTQPLCIEYALRLGRTRCLRALFLFAEYTVSLESAIMALERGFLCSLRVCCLANALRPPVVAPLAHRLVFEWCKGRMFNAKTRTFLRKNLLSRFSEVVCLPVLRLIIRSKMDLAFSWMLEGIPSHTLECCRA